MSGDAADVVEDAVEADDHNLLFVPLLMLLVRHA